MRIMFVRSIWSRFASILAAVALLSPSLAGPAASEVSAPEFAIKAAYLLKFPPFIDWPASAFATSTSPFNLCVLGPDPFGASLDEAVRGRQVGAHPVRLERMDSAANLADCQILYVGGASSSVDAEALKKVRAAPVLTVTEEGSGLTGSIVQFVVRGGHVRFNIDTAAASASGVVISAKLLDLAAAFRGES